MSDRPPDELDILPPRPFKWRKIEDLETGDRLDLAGDTVADPLNNNPYFDDEYQVVARIEVNEGTVIAHLLDDSFSFPLGHMVKALEGLFAVRFDGKVVQKFHTLPEAERFIASMETTDAENVQNGRYTISGPEDMRPWNSPTS